MSKTSKYTDYELINEITEAVEDLGGSIQLSDANNNLFKLTINADLKSEVYLIINNIINKYKTKRKDLMAKDLFVRVKAFRKHLFG